MTDILIGQHSRNSWQRPGTTATLRIWFSGEFRDTNGVMVDPGNGTSSFFKIVPCTVNPTTHIVTIPAFTLPSTLDAIPAVIQSYGRLYDEAGTPRDFLWSQWSLSNLPTSLPFDSWFIFNQGSSLSNPPDFYLNRQEVIALIDSLLGLAGQGIVPEIPAGVINGSNATFTLSQTPVAGSVDLYLNGVLQQEGSLGAGSNSYTISGSTITHNGPPLPGDWLFASYRTASVLFVPPSLASFINIGISSLSAAPISSLLPVAVGNNDPRVVDVSSYASFIAALSAIGATPTTFNIHTAITGVTTATVPSTVTLRFLQGGSLSVTTGQTLTINGPIIADAVKIFDNALAGQGTASFTGNRKVRTFYPEWWGAVGDSSTDCFASIQAAEVALEAVKSGEMIFGSGSVSASYNVSAAIQISRVKGIRWAGNGPDNTRIVATSGQPAVQTLGCWRSKFEGLMFRTTALITNKGVFELDGDGTQGVQGNSFERCYFDANQLAESAFNVCRVGGSGAQGSENLYVNCNFDGGTFASYYQNGFNALNNTFIGGNFQSHSRHGIYIIAGSVYIFSVGFQSTFGYAQITNDGYDINADSSGVGERITVIGCRTESLRFYRGAASQPAVLIGNNQRVGTAQTWTALTAYTLNQHVVKTSPTLGDALYRVTTAGTSGAGEPVWPDSGTIADGSAVWTMTDFDAIKTAKSQIISTEMQVGFISQSSMAENETREITTDYTVKLQDELILCLNTTDITVKLPVFTGTASVRPAGRRYIIKKVLTNAATVTVMGSDTGTLDGSASHTVLPGGARGWVVAEQAGGGGVAAAYWIISRSLDPDPVVRRLIPNLGTTLVAGDFALSAGWGTTASVSFPSGNSKDARGFILVTSAGTGQAANPTVTLTFKDGAWPNNGPFAMACRGAGSQRTVPVTVSSVSTTALVIRFEGTPVAAETYEIYWIVQG